jgi:hypothetical protein
MLEPEPEIGVCIRHINNKLLKYGRLHGSPGKFNNILSICSSSNSMLMCLTMGCMRNLIIMHNFKATISILQGIVSRSIGSRLIDNMHAQLQVHNNAQFKGIRISEFQLLYY